MKGPVTTLKSFIPFGHSVLTPPPPPLMSDHGRLPRSLDYSGNCEVELDACRTRDELLSKLDEIIARHWDGKSKLTTDQVKGGVWRNSNDWTDIESVRTGQRKMCWLVSHRNAAWDQSYCDFVERLKQVGLVVYEYTMPMEDDDYNSTDLHMEEHYGFKKVAGPKTLHNGLMVCSSESQETRARLFIEASLVSHTSYVKTMRLFRELHQLVGDAATKGSERATAIKEQLAAGDDDDNDRTHLVFGKHRHIKFGLLLGYTVADVLNAGCVCEEALTPPP